MNAGKTTSLLQSNFNYNERGMKTLLFIPFIINECKTIKNGFIDYCNHLDKFPNQELSISYVQSRVGLQTSAFGFTPNFSFTDYSLIANTICDYSCILIDEAQFLTKKQVLELSILADKIPILTYGIRSDINGEPFIGSQYLLTVADHLKEIKTICYCGKKATMNLKLNHSYNKTNTIDSYVNIGGNDKYISVCRFHFNQRFT
jgi:thymidine kinase